MPTLPPLRQTEAAFPRGRARGRQPHTWNRAWLLKSTSRSLFSASCLWPLVFWKSSRGSSTEYTPGSRSAPPADQGPTGVQPEVGLQIPPHPPSTCLPGRCHLQAHLLQEARPDSQQPFSPLLSLAPALAGALVVRAQGPRGKWAWENHVVFWCLGFRH